MKLFNTITISFSNGLHFWTDLTVISFKFTKFKVGWDFSRGKMNQYYSFQLGFVSVLYHSCKTNFQKHKSLRLVPEGLGDELDPFTYKTVNGRIKYSDED